jgi:hypothetical protein
VFLLLVYIASYQMTPLFWSAETNPILRNGETGDWIGTFQGHTCLFGAAALTKMLCALRICFCWLLSVGFLTLCSSSVCWCWFHLSSQYQMHPILSPYQLCFFRFAYWFVGHFVTISVYYSCIIDLLIEVCTYTLIYCSTWNWLLRSHSLLKLL